VQVLALFSNRYFRSPVHGRAVRLAVGVSIWSFRPAPYKSATLKLMMSREQRIEYEILDCTFRDDLGPGYLTDTKTFTQLLRGLFPDIRPEEFTDACKRLQKGDRLDVRYRVGEDVQMVFAGKFYLARARLSHDYFEELRRLIELPTFRGRIGPGGGQKP
jgi:hypothetical protein